MESFPGGKTRFLALNDALIKIKSAKLVPDNLHIELKEQRKLDRKRISLLMQEKNTSLSLLEKVTHSPYYVLLNLKHAMDHH